MPVSTRGLAAREASDRRSGLMNAVASLVFAYLPLSVQAITLPALSKAWKQWAEEQGAKERALEEAKIAAIDWKADYAVFYVPAWAAQQHPQQLLLDAHKRRFQLRALAHGDVGAAETFSMQTWNLSLCASAARGGQLLALQWLRDRGCAWDAGTCWAAALGGHLAVLQWARANGCVWDAKTCSAAARGGHLAVLQWAVANGCPEHDEEEEDDESDEQD
jgi:hypothetical protein